ncbi:hypothetical protein M3M33_16240, partial [Loigolactobacillus coryniformis]|uniref:hypothetical protein n=1 Tax=Loigolactobacillus coryniformis TaxID=1610 RepID=UPI00201B0B3C
IRISVWAYAYEFETTSLVSDAEFDAECYKVNRAVLTGHSTLDGFFSDPNKFDPCTGQWIHQHPELEGIGRLYKSRIYS